MLFFSPLFSGSFLFLFLSLPDAREGLQKKEQISYSPFSSPFPSFFSLGYVLPFPPSLESK